MNWPEIIQRRFARPRPVVGARPYQRVLLATDFTPRSDCALERLALLPLAAGATCTLLHVPEADDPAQARERGLVARALQGRVARLTRMLPAVQIDVRVDERQRSLPDALLTLAEEAEAELIVAGRPHRTAGWGRLSRVRRKGAVAEPLGVPMLFVAPGVQQPYRRPLACIELEPRSGRAVVSAALRVASIAPELTAVHVADTSYDLVVRSTSPSVSRALEVHAQALRRAEVELHELLAPCARSGPRIREVVVAGSPPEAICRTAVDVDADLIVVGHHPRSALGRLVSPHAADLVLAERCSDVLVVPIAARAGHQPVH